MARAVWDALPGLERKQPSMGRIVAAEKGASRRRRAVRRGEGRWARGEGPARRGEGAAGRAAPLARSLADPGLRPPHARAEPRLAREGSPHRRALLPAARRLDRGRGHLARHRPPAGPGGRLEPGRRAAPAARARAPPLPRARPPHRAGGPPHGRRRTALARPPGNGRGLTVPLRATVRYPAERWPPLLLNWTSFRGALRRCGGRFDIERKRARVELIERESVQPGFWEDQKRAQHLSREKSQLELAIASFEREKERLEDALALHELAEEANDEQARAEARVATREAGQGVERLELSRMLSGPQDHLNAIVEINAGAGGTESQDWAQMLYRMYKRYAERKGWEVEPGAGGQKVNK